MKYANSDLSVICAGDTVNTARFVLCWSFACHGSFNKLRFYVPMLNIPNSHPQSTYISRSVPELTLCDCSRMESTSSPGCIQCPEVLFSSGFVGLLSEYSTVCWPDFQRPDVCISNASISCSKPHYSSSLFTGDSQCIISPRSYFVQFWV